MFSLPLNVRVLFCLFCFFVVGLLPSHASDELSNKYYEMLRERPNSEVLFDRFYDQWLGQASLADLEVMLAQACSAAGATANDSRILVAFYQRQGDEASALRVIKAALELDASSATLWLQRARVEWALLDFEAAIQSLTQALELELDEDSAIAARRLLGTVYARSGQLEAAQQVWLQLLADYPGESELMEDLIELQIGEGLLQEALATAHQLVEQTREPYQKTLYQLWVGDILQRKGETEPALELYEALIDRVGNGSWLEREVIAQISQLLANQSGGVSALDFFTKLSERYPQRIGIRQTRVRLLASSGQVDEAVSAFQEILKLTPGDRSQREAYVDLLQQHGRLVEALRELDQLCDLYPKDSELCLLRVQLQGQTDDVTGLKQAIAAFAQSVGTEPSARLRVARLYAGFDLQQEAGAIFAALAEAHGDDLEMIESYALWLFGQEDTDAAVALWQEVAQEQGRDGLLRVAQSLVSIGEGETAYALLQARVDEFAVDAIFLQQLCQLAMAHDAAEEALPWAKILVLQADSPLEMSRAVQLAAQVAQTAKVVDVLILELQQDAEAGTLKLPELCLLAELEESQGDSRASEATLARLRSVGGAIALSEEVRLFENRRQPKLAIRALEKLITLPAEENPVNLRRLVGLLEAERRWTQATQVIDTWKRISPGDPQVWMRESDVLAASGQFELAQQQLRRAVHKFEDAADLQLRLASLYKQTQSYAAAERIYWQMFEASESLADRLRWLHELALSARESGRIFEYSQRLAAMRQADRQAMLPLLAMADLYRLQNDYSQLLATLRKAERLEPENIEVLDQLITILESLGEYESAESSLRRLLSLQPTESNRRRLINFFMRTGEQDAAFAMIKSGTSTVAPDATSLESFIDLLMDSGEWELAEVEAQAAYQKFPLDWRIGYQLAVCYAENFKVEQAIELFLNLRQAREELSRLPASSASAAPSAVSHYTDALPPASREIAQILQDSRLVFLHQQPGSRRIHFGVNARSQQFLHLPNDLASLKRAVVLHLGALVSSLSESSAQAVMVQMTELGIDHPELFVAIEGARASNGRWAQSFVSYAEAHPEQLELLPLLAQYGAYGAGTLLNKENILRGFEAYADEYPRLGMQFAFQLVHLDAENTKFYVDFILDALGEETWTPDSQAGLMAIGQLLNLVNVGGQRVQSIELTAAQRARIRELAAVNHMPEKLSASNPQLARLYAFAFQVLVALALEDADFTVLFEVLEDHIAATESQVYSRNLQSQYMLMSHNLRQGVQLDLQVPALAPFQSGFVPDHIAILFIKEPVRQYHPMMHFMNLDRIQKMDTLKLGERLDAIKHPRLKFLAAWRSGQADVCGRILADLIAVDSPRMEDLKLLALWQYHELEDIESAVQTLERARTLASARMDRERLDQLVVAMALTLPEDSFKDAGSLQNVVASAALRLRSTAQRSSAQVPTLAHAMRSLGMEADAQRFEESAQRMPASAHSSPRNGVNPFVTTNQDPFSKMDAFVQQGKTEAAVGIAVRQLRPLLGQTSTHRNSLRNPVQRIQKAELTDLVLRRFDPQDSRSHQRMQSYATLLDALGRNEEASQYWKKLQAMRPNVVVYALETAFRSSSIEEATAALKKLLAAKFFRQIDDEFGSWIAQKIQYSHELRFDEWMRLLDLLTFVMDTIEPSANSGVNLTCGPYFALKLAQTAHIGGQPFPRLIQESTRRHSTPNDDAYLARVQQRSTRYEAFCQAMLAHPQTARQGFELLQLKRSIDDVDTYADPELVEAALTAALLDAQYTPPPIQHGQANQRWAFTWNGGASYANANFESLSPLVFLIRLAERGEGIDELKQLSTQLAEHDAALSADLTAIIALLEADEKPFTALVEGWMSTVGSEQRMSLLFEAFRLGAANDTTLQALFKFGLAQLETTTVYQELDVTLCAQIATIFIDQKRNDLLERWFDEVFTIYLGPKAGWRDLVASYTPHGMYTSGSVNSRLAKVWQLTQKMSEQSDVFMALVRYTRQTGIGLAAYSSNNLRQSMMAGFDTVSEALEWCEDQALLSKFEDFDPLIILDSQRIQQGLSPEGFSSANRQILVYEHALRNLSFQDDDKGEKKKQFLSQLKARGFGGMILAAFIEGDSQGRSTAVDALEAHRSAFFALPEPKQQALAFLYRFWIKDDQVADTDASVVAHLQQVWQRELHVKANEYLSLSTPMTDQIYHMELQQLRGWIAAMVLDAPELAAQLYLHWLTREASYMPTHQRFPASQRDSYNENLLRSAFNQTRNNGRALQSLNRYLTYVAEHHPDGAVTLPQQSIRQLSEIWRNRFQKETGTSSPKLEQVLAALPSIVPSEDSPERYVSALGLFHYVLNSLRYSRNDADEIAATLNGGSLDSSLHHQWLRAAMLARMVGDRSGHSEAAEALAQILNDSQVPVQVRLALLMIAHHQSSSRWLYQASLAEPSCALITAYTEQNFPIFDRDWGEMLKRMRTAFSDPEWRTPLLAVLPKLVATLPTQIGDPEREMAENVVEATIRMALDLNEIDTAMAVINQHFNLVRGDSRILFAMLSAGQLDTAIKLTPLDGKFEVNSGMRYTAELHAHLPAYLAKVANPTSRYNLAVQLGSLEDAKALAESDVPNQSERCTALLQEFDGHQDGIRAVAQLNQLCQHATDKTAMIPYAAKLVGEVSFRELIDASRQGSTDARRLASGRLELYKHLTMALLISGNADDLVASLGLMPGDEYDSQTLDFLRQLQVNSAAAFLGQFVAWTASEFEASLPQARVMVELFFQSEKLNTRQEAKRAYFIYLLTHIGAGSADQIDTDLSENTLNNLAELKKRWDRPESRIREILHWMGHGDEYTEWRRAALRLILSDHARIDEFWSTSPKALWDALRGNTGTERARDMEVVLSELNTASHPRSEWMQLLLGQELLDQEGADIVQLIRLFAPGIAEITKPSELRNYHQKFAARWSERLLKPDGTTSYEDAWQGIGEVVDQLETDAEREWAGSTLYYYTRNDRKLNKGKAADEAWIQRHMQPESVAHRMGLLGILYRAQANQDPIPSEMKKTLMSIFEDTHLPFYLRYQSCIDIVNTRYYKKTDGELYRSVAGLLNEYLDSGYDLSDNTADRLLQKFYLKELDEALETEARSMLKAWCEAVITQTDFSRFSGSGYNTVRTLSLLSLKFGELEQVDALANLIESANWTNIDYYMWLIRLRKYELAAAFIEKRDLLGNTYYTFGYDAELHAALPAFIERYDTPEARYRIELTFACLVDSKQFPLPADVPDRNARARSLLERFGAHAEDPDAAKMLDLITSDETLELLAAPTIAQFCESMNLSLLFADLHRNRIDLTSLSLYLKHLSNQVRVGQFQQIQDELKLLSEFKLDRNGYNRLRGPFEALLHNLNRGLIDDAMQGDPERMQAWLSLAETLCQVYDDPQLTYRGRNQRRVYLLYHLARAAAMPEGLADSSFLQSAAYQALDQYFDRSGMRNLVNLDDALGRGETELERERLFMALRLLLQNEAFLDQRWTDRADQLPSGLRFKTEFKRTALLKVLPERIAAGTVYEPWYAYILAEYAYIPQELTDEAIQWYQRARETGLASEQPKFSSIAGEATLRLAGIWQEQPDGRARARKLLEATPDHAYTEEGLEEAKSLLVKLNSNEEN